MYKVYLDKCDNYNVNEIRSKLEESIEFLGGFDKYFKSGEKVLLKVNLLMKKTPQEATTTHPAFVQALASLLVDKGLEVIIGDSPGGPYNENALRGIYKATGMIQAAQSSGASLNDDYETVEIHRDDAKILKRSTVIRAMTKVDKVVSVSKLKTHSMAVFTGAVKNMFGTIPGIMKAQYHLTMPRKEDFADMLVDVCQNASPVLSFMDGIVGMEGAGPSAGDPIHIGAVLVSDSPYHLDQVASKLVGINGVPTIEATNARGLTRTDMADIEYAKMTPEEFGIRSIKKPKAAGLGFIDKFLPSKTARAIEKKILPKPSFDFDKCVKCGECERACPPEAITINEKGPVVDLNKCIRCFCCQELCSFKAVTVQRNSLFDRILRL